MASHRKVGHNGASPAHALGEAARLAAEAQRNPRIGRALAQALECSFKCLRGGGRIFLCGNGGSMGEATHLAGELVGPFYDRKRRPFAAIPLGFDASSLTAVANDFGYEQVFARQLAGLAKRGDVLWALTTSGKSPNVLAALREAKKLGLARVLFTNHHGGPARRLAGVVLSTPKAPTPRVQELHLVYGHWLCEQLEARLAPKRGRKR